MATHRKLWEYGIIPLGDGYETQEITDELEERVVAAAEATGAEVAGVTYVAEDGSPMLMLYLKAPATDEQDEAMFAAVSSLVPNPETSMELTPEQYAEELEQARG
jgi:hypothetical protein